MGARTDLQMVLEGITTNVYFQPPPNVMMSYPCIVYTRSNGDTIFADNMPYSIETRYTITVIDKNPDSEIPPKIAALCKCIYDRHYISENLNHDVFSIYF